MSSDRTSITGLVSHHGAHDGEDEPHHAPHDAHHIGPLARLWGLLKTERNELVLVVIYAIGVGIFSLATPLTAMAVVNTAAMATL